MDNKSIKSHRKTRNRKLPQLVLPNARKKLYIFGSNFENEFCCTNKRYVVRDNTKCNLLLVFTLHL